MTESSVLTLSDGRVFEYIDNGVAGSRAVVLHIGTPGTALAWQLWLDEFTKLGIRAIAPNRAGYGRSTRNPSATIESARTDTAELLAHLGIVDFVSVGYSGGGPSTLADALLENCIASNPIAGLSSIQLQGESFFDGYGEASITDIKANLVGWDSGFAKKQKELEELRAGRESGSSAWWEGREQIEKFRSDYDVFGITLSRAMSDAVADGGLAWQDDESRFLGDWGFTLDQIKAPVYIWQGENDTAVPVGQARWLAANIADAKLTVFAGDSHTSIIVERRAEIFNALLKQLL